ncbi:uncharacterized protein MONOS_17076 [Monocercomonoides exilis]|uniref:uncharacterized protein n=1 Tax=Monocercomonoides exilis TaxID=2049356 RepID=UPI003559BA66|nr:hypothetical protein MONOS_17076 [Monocercomonoides exilis]
MISYLIQCALTRRMTLEYYTNQSYYYTFFYFVIIVTYGRKIAVEEPLYFPLQQGHGSITLRDTAIYILSCLGLPGSATATLGYWAFLFSEETTPMFVRIWFGANPHGFSLIFILIDLLCFNGMTWKWIHCLIPLLYICVYVGFAYGFYAINHHYIYSFLDYTKKMFAFALPALALCPSLIFLLDL